MANLSDFNKTDLIDDHVAADVNNLIAATMRSEYKNVQTLIATRTLLDIDTPIQRYECGAADRIVKAPTANAVENHPYFIVNGSAAARTITLQNNAGTVTIATLTQGESVMILPDGNGGYLTDTTLARLGGVAHSLATAANDFLVSSGAGVFVKKTLAQTQVILGVTALQLNGSATLGSSFTITGTAGTYQDTGLSITLPAAGTYIVTADIRGQLTGNAGTLWWLHCKLYNSTDAADVANSERLIVLTGTTGLQLQNSCPLIMIITVAASKVIKLYAARNGSTSPSWTASGIITDSSGRTSMTYQGIS